MIVCALNESPTDTRVAISPNAVKHLSKIGLHVQIQSEAGHAAGFSDADYVAAGAAVLTGKDNILKNTSILLAVTIPNADTLQHLPPQSLVVAPFDKEIEQKLIDIAQQKQLNLFSMNLIPRISRAQSMDSLSSQANIAGYRAVLMGVEHYKRAIPMMMTAAGMIHPAKILVLGAGVAGLQAIATAKRLGGVIYAFDVRRAAKEQVESLGAEFIEVSENVDAETQGGYAQEMSEEYKHLQGLLIEKYASMSDIIICTALIPGKKAPLLLAETVVAQMKPGSVIVDMATSRGGNCAVSIKDSITTVNGVTVVGYSNIAGFVPATASELYASNFTSLLKLLLPTADKINYNFDDEIIQQALVCHEGKYRFDTPSNAKELSHA